ncbi:C-type lectin domain family 7 member A-like isoform X1 [Equus przewalskii]|uniref:C-type lectin domain-containing protein n=2 Tax=Equus TaxID=9789 RepID=A0A3Q2H511_HORSE|nr:PREDICTED: C-type lectin domain family 7 member A-like [Equus przewalskii]XP_023498886.1 C-type lectin domain family 7 member A-like [Equus caballus]
MSEERVTYTELKLPYSKKQRNKRHPTRKKGEFPWRGVAIILGIICFFLLLAITGLGYMYFWNSSEGKRRDMKDAKEKNTSSLDVENHSVLPSSTGKDYDTCQEKWSCCGKNCYYFSKEEKTWDESKTSCQGLGSSLIKIDDKEEQIFIQSKIKYKHWIGLHRKGANHPWMWQDGSAPSRKLNFQQTTPNAKCGHIKSASITTTDCTQEFHFICEKKFTCLDN